MHPRTLAKDSCSGGSCPAVYDSDPDLLPDELAIVGSTEARSLRSRLAESIAPGEGLIVIKRNLVERALRPADEPVTAAEFAALFDTFSYSAFRLETYQRYVGTGPDLAWAAQVKARTRQGKVHQRVHVVLEPLTEDMREELAEGYPGNVAAGEEIGIIAAGAGTWPGPDVPAHDFWLFDSSYLYVMNYEPDGAWAGAVCVSDPARVVAACRARDAALHRAIPWREYVTSRPELQRQMAQ